MAPGFDYIFTDFLKHLGPRAAEWLARLFTQVHKNGRLPAIWKKAKVIAVAKPKKSAEDVRSLCMQTTTR